MLAVGRQGREQLVEQMTRERLERQGKTQEAPSSPYPHQPDDPQQP